MKLFYLTILNLITCLPVFCQTNSCNNRLDTAHVIKIAKRNNAYWQRTWLAQPTIKFDEQNCTWTVVSSKSSHTNRGECQYTNGCTLVKTVTLVIDAKTKKVLSKNTHKKLYPNYE